MSRRGFLGVVLSVLVLCGSLPSRADKDSKERIELTALIIEGLLIRSGDKGVLIDAFVDANDPKSDSAGASLRQDMLAGRSEFSDIHLALVSHPHREHFHAPTAGEFLLKHPETVLASSHEIAQAIRDEFPEHKKIKDQIKTVATKKSKTASFALPGISVDFIPFRHEASAFYSEQVLGHLIQIGGRKLLYVGDAEMHPSNWRPHDLKSQDIDIALVPFWLFVEDVTRDIIDKYVAPDKVVVIQIPTEGLQDKVAEVAQAFPDVIFLSTAMATAEF